MSERPFPQLPGQRGLATTIQLQEAGWTASAMRHARRTRWQEPMPRVIAPHRGGLDRDTRLIALGLWAGEKAVLTGGAALQRLGMAFERPAGTTFVIPDLSRTRTHRLVRLIRSARTPSIARKLGLVPIAAAARALADAAVYEQHRPDSLEQLAIQVLQRGLAKPEDLERELWLRPRASVDPVWQGLGAYVNGAWSRPEAILRELIETRGQFPPLITNCRLLAEDGEMLGVPDGYFEEAGVAVQVHSRQYHQGIDDAGGDKWAQTVEKDSAMVAAGVRVLGVSPWTLYAQPARFLNRLQRAVAVGAAGPRPNVRVVH